MNTIRIGTLVRGKENPAATIRQLLTHGFESFSIFFWQTVGAVDLQHLADDVLHTLDGSGAVISSLGLYGNPLEDGEADHETRQGLEMLIDHAHRFGTDIVGAFTGRLRNRPIHESLHKYISIWKPLADRAAERGVKIAFENCSMRGNWDSGDWNIAHNPVAWSMMFEALPDAHLGLEWEPCHQLVSLIDPLPQVREWGHRIFHIHGKDASVNWSSVKKYGIHTVIQQKEAAAYGLPVVPPYAHHRTPGFGDSNWTDIISELRWIGYTGTIDIEGWHDPVYCGDLEMTGQVHALNYLRNCRGGTWIPNV